MGKVIPFQNAQDIQAQKVMDEILELPEEQFIEVLRKGRDDFLARGKKAEARLFVEIGVHLRATKLLERIGHEGSIP